MPPLPAFGQRGFAVSRKLVHMALEARSAVAARLVRGAEFLEIGATGLAHTHMAAFAACLSTTAWVGLAAHGGQAKKGDEEDGGFSHGTWLKRVVAQLPSRRRVPVTLDALRVAINRGRPPDGGNLLH